MTSCSCKNEIMLYVLKRNYKNFVTKLILNIGYSFSMII